jgi:hypothetical protein
MSEMKPEEPVMPIPTPELERYYLLNGQASADDGDLAFVEGPIYVASEVEAILSERAQEIAKLDHQRLGLGQALGRIIVAMGISRDASMTGPELLLFAKEAEAHTETLMDTVAEFTQSDEGEFKRRAETAEALLLQRAQEIEQVQALLREHLRQGDFGDKNVNYCWFCGEDVNGRDGTAKPHAGNCLGVRSDAALVSRAPQPEQDTQQLVQELTAALQDRPDRERTHWAGCHTDPRHRDCAIARLLAAIARADQP